jgi:rhamnogalacturonan endolyase
MLLGQVALAAVAFTGTAHAAFGITSSGSNYVIDAGSENSLKVSVNQKSCDITSIVYRGEELQDAQGSHISSGLGSATVKAETISGSLRLHL